jgi:hypothetical protein
MLASISISRRHLRWAFENSKLLASAEGLKFLAGLEGKPDFDIVHEIQEFHFRKKIQNVFKGTVAQGIPLLKLRDLVMELPDTTVWRIDGEEGLRDKINSKIHFEKKKIQMIRFVQMRNQIDRIEISHHLKILPLNFERILLKDD